jgi:hypothetical protein
MRVSSLTCARTSVMVLQTLTEACEIVPDTTTGALVSGTLAASTWKTPRDVHKVVLLAASFA